MIWVQTGESQVGFYLYSHKKPIVRKELGFVEVKVSTASLKSNENVKKRNQKRKLMRMITLGDWAYELSSQIGYVGMVVDYVGFYITVKIEITQQRMNATPQHALSWGEAFLEFSRRISEQDLLLNAALRVGEIAIKDRLRVTMWGLPSYPRENLPRLVEEALTERETELWRIVSTRLTGIANAETHLVQRLLSSTQG